MAGGKGKDIGCGVIILIVAAVGIMSAIFLSKEMNQLLNWLFQVH